jgi:AraC-like DNA-binding protein
MQVFYRKALLALIFLVIANLLLASWCLYLSYPAQALLPAGTMPWHYGSYADAVMDGTSSIRIDARQRERLRFDYTLTGVAKYPSVSAELTLADSKGTDRVMDWSKYGTVTFMARCQPANSLMLMLSVFDDAVSRPGDFRTYRPAGTYFTCNERGMRVSLDLNRLSVPEWWFSTVRLDPSRQGYGLERVARIVFATSYNSPRDIPSHVEISDLVLHGRDERYLVAAGFIAIASIAAFGLWFFRAYSRALVASLGVQLARDRPLVAYRQLTLEPYRDREKAAVLKYIATNYANTELDLECVATGTGVNRNKINEVLKSELGMTFTAYLKTLRLTEAARLLAANGNAAIAEIAYSVGDGNVSYFNKLFKEEYGCTPKAFRAHATQPGTGPATGAAQGDSAGAGA